MNRDESMFDNTVKILKDIGKLTKVDEWEIKFHGSDNTIRIKKESI